MKCNRSDPINNIMLFNHVYSGHIYLPIKYTQTIANTGHSAFHWFLLLMRVSECQCADWYRRSSGVFVLVYHDYWLGRSADGDGHHLFSVRRAGAKPTETPLFIWIGFAILFATKMQEASLSLVTFTIFKNIWNGRNDTDSIACYLQLSETSILN